MIVLLINIAWNSQAEDILGFVGKFEVFVKILPLTFL